MGQHCRVRDQLIQLIQWGAGRGISGLSDLAQVVSLMSFNSRAHRELSGMKIDELG